MIQEQQKAEESIKLKEAEKKEVQQAETTVLLQSFTKASKDRKKIGQSSGDSATTFCTPSYIGKNSAATCSCS